MKGKTRKILFVIWEYLVITVGCAIFVMGWTSFMLPNGIIDGGLTGICAVLSMATGISVDIFYISLQVILIILAVWIMGTSFGAKTLYARWKLVTYTISYDLAGGTLVEENSKSYTIESFQFRPIMG